MSNSVAHTERLPSSFAIPLILFLVAVLSEPVSAQQRPGFPFSDPQKMFDQFFGGAPQEERAEIDKINMSRREEAEIGERASREYLARQRSSGTKVLSRGKEVEYLRALVAQVQPLMKNTKRYPRIRVYIVDSNKTDARSFPGGTLIFFRGMLEFAQNEAALVGVVGHELSHLDHGHQLYDAKRAKLMQSTFSGDDGFSPDTFFRNGAMLMCSFSKPFRPEDESQADKDGAKWAYELGYDPREMAKLFLRMHERDRGAKPNVPSFLRTHPYHLDRFEALSGQFDQLQADDPKEDIYIGVKNLADRVPRAEREF